MDDVQDDVADADAGEGNEERGGTPDRAERRRRAKEVRTLCRSLGLSTEFADDAIDAELTDADLHARAIGELQRRTSPTIRTRHNDTTNDNPEVRVRSIGEALFSRTTHDHELSEPARRYVGFTMLDVARDCLRAASINTTALSPMRTIERALTTSDFPLIMGDAVGRTLRAA